MKKSQTDTKRRYFIKQVVGTLPVVCGSSLVNVSASSELSTDGGRIRSKNTHVSGMTVAIFNMEKMLAFYRDVFEVDFVPKHRFGATLYECRWGDLVILFCPAEIARNETRQNRHQLDIAVDDLNTMIRKVRRAGGKIEGGVTESGGFKIVGISDPDNNTLLLKAKR